MLNVKSWNLEIKEQLDQVQGFFLKANPFNRAYAIARTLLAIGTLLTLIFTSTGDLFRLGSGTSNLLNCQELLNLSLYCVAGETNIPFAKGFSIIVLLLVISGFYPRWVAPLHWWVAISLNISGRTVDGGEQVTSVLTFLIAIVALSDSRRNHWNISPAPSNSLLFTNSIIAMIVIKLQVAIIYFHAATAKFKVTEWVDGTALYYWFNSPFFGLAEPLKTLFAPILNSSMVTVLTWTPLFLEVALAFAFLMDRRPKKVLLILGIVFHISIAIFMGIASFSIAMIAALFLYIYPIHDSDSQVVRNT